MKNRHAFTIVELIVGAAVSSVLAVAIFALMNAGMILSAKNLSLNLTSNTMRGALDRVEQVVQQADTMPELIDTTGTVITTGPAAGIKFDRAVGSPYVVTVTAGTIPSATTTLTLTRSTNAVASPAVPSVGDIIRIATTASTLRPRIQTVSVGAIDGQLRQPFTIGLTAALGTTITPASGAIVTARLVRNAAFLVMTSNGKRELRYYHTFDTATNLADITKYSLITDQIGAAPEDGTPFSLIQYENKSFVSFSLRVRASNADQGMRSQQRDQYSTYSRTETLIRPKTTP